MIRRLRPLLLHRPSWTNLVHGLKSSGVPDVELNRPKSLTFSTSRSSHFHGFVGDSPGRLTVEQARRQWTRRFRQNRIPDADSSARIILAHLFDSANVGILQLKKNTELTSLQRRALDSMGRSRLKRTPVQYIIGEWDFLDLTVRVRPPVFIPRPETESLVLLASRYLNNATRCLEIGTGTGVISLSLAKRHPRLSCVAIDANPDAVALAAENAQKLGLTEQFRVSHAVLDERGINPHHHLNLDDKFGLIVSNPPYIPTSEITNLAPEITQYEDVLALDGGSDGADLIRMILKHAPDWLAPGGWIVLEMDPRQVDIVRTAWKGAIRVHSDCFGVQRLVALQPAVAADEATGSNC